MATGLNNGSGLKISTKSVRIHLTMHLVDTNYLTTTGIHAILTLSLLSVCDTADSQHYTQDDQ